MFYDSVDNIINEVGETIVYKRATVKARGDVTSSGIDFVESSIKCYVSDYKPNNMKPYIENAKKYVRISGKQIDFKPNIADYVVIDGTSYKMVRIDNRKFKEQNVLYILYVGN